jgi:hypothetical protein
VLCRSIIFFDYELRFLDEANELVPNYFNFRIQALFIRKIWLGDRVIRKLNSL